MCMALLCSMPMEKLMTSCKSFKGKVCWCCWSTFKFIFTLVEGAMLWKAPTCLLRHNLWCKIKLWHVTIHIKVIMIMFARELNWWFYTDLFMWKCISIRVAYPWYCQTWDNVKESRMDYCLVTMLKDYYLMLNYVLIIMSKIWCLKIKW
jgi:hypothetical protein